MNPNTNQIISHFLFTGGLSTTAMVKIQLTDINDNRPTFYPREYNVSLRESVSASSASTPVVVVVATDPDSGRFGTVTYRIVAGNEASIFRIDRVTGELFVSRPNMLSSRNQPYHRLNISASDGGGLRTNQDAEVFISVIDSAQRPPIFEKPRYTYYIKEDVKKNTIVGSVSATSSNSGKTFIFHKLTLSISRNLFCCFIYMYLPMHKVHLFFWEIIYELQLNLFQFLNE